MLKANGKQEEKTRPKAARRGSNNRPTDWKSTNFWKDSKGYQHPIDPSAPDVFPVHGATPDWVYERRGLPRQEIVVEIPIIKDISFTLSDLGNAERFSAYFHSVCQYVPELSLWRVYNGKCWRDDEDLCQMRWYGSLVVRKIYTEAERYEDKSDRESIIKHALKSEGTERIKAMIIALTAEPGMSKPLDEWDNDKYLLNVDNGTIDLRTGELRPRKREDYITNVLPTKYEPDATCELWDKFIHKCTGGDAELAGYLQRAVGYSLTGDTRTQLFFFLYGLGNNGKSVFTKTIRKILGTLAARVSTELFMVKDKAASGGPKEGLANLRGKRMIIAPEVEEGKQLATSLIKDLTGGESVTADRKYGHEVEFLPECKLWLVGNHKPIIKDTTISTWRRVKLIPFTVTIPAEEIDEQLAQKLEPEYPGILAWMVKGCLIWYAGGLRDVEAITTATTDYKATQDVLHDYLGERCLFKKSEGINQSALYSDYKVWCEINDTYTISKPNFRNRIQERGVIPGRGAGNKANWQGIRLFTDEERVNLVNKVTDLPLNLLYEKSKKRYPKNRNEINLINSGTLPDCVCGKNEWVYTPKGKLLCPCGKMLAEVKL